MTDDMPRTVTVTDDEILESFSEIPCPIRTAPGIAADMDIGSDAVRKRLKKLEGDDKVESKSVGAHAVVWWRAD